MSPWTVIHQAPLSTEFSRQEYWSVILFPSPEDLPNPRIKLGSSALQSDSLPSDTGWQYTALMYFFSSFEPVCCSMSGSNCCFLTYLQVFQKTGKMVWYSHLFSLKCNFWILILACSYVNINVQYFSSLFWATGSKTLGKQTNKQIPNTNNHFLRNMKVKMLFPQSCLTVCDPWTVAHQVPLSVEFSRKNTGMGSHSFLQGIFLIQGLNPGLLHSRWK